MKTRYTALAACLAALALTACGSTSSGNVPQTASAAPATDSGACRLLANNEGKGKNMVYRCNVSRVLATPDARAALDSNIPVSFGAGGKYRTNASARSFGRDEAASCERAVVNAVNNLQVRVKKDGGKRLTNVESYAAQNNGRFDRNRMLPAGEADCIVATFQTRVVMRGSVR
ncbi:hypothetical protein [Neisseria chenwenguii]|uniref:Uncharacterized protein n=1 Tax=Neisseria chenwenguii TaxID=1853278 RepID=A0A220S404_9NEIS|nr:hypothetical protein [Neisseria chenwenguii]ASK28063.1 hypothetical protein BG910_10280 [Neisseria chenwenguii]ROV57213.1 hypothetical protein EGS38_00540 [Neisseria chenwenguii]